eukprot:1986544-Prymnesium_polylepis.1
MPAAVSELPGGWQVGDSVAYTGPSNKEVRVRTGDLGTVVGSAKPKMQAFAVSVRFEHLLSPTFSILAAHLPRGGMKDLSPAGCPALIPAGCPAGYKSRLAPGCHLPRGGVVARSC